MFSSLVIWSKFVITAFIDSASSTIIPSDFSSWALSSFPQRRNRFACPKITASGVFSSCETSLVKPRSRSKSFFSLTNKSLNVTASLSSSSKFPAEISSAIESFCFTGKSSPKFVLLIFFAASVIFTTGASVLLAIRRAVKKETSKTGKNASRTITGIPRKSRLEESVSRFSAVWITRLPYSSLSSSIAKYKILRSPSIK